MKKEARYYILGTGALIAAIIATIIPFYFVDFLANSTFESVRALLFMWCFVFYMVSPRYYYFQLLNLASALGFYFVFIATFH